MPKWVSEFFSQVHRDHLKKLGFKKTRHTFSRDRDNYCERFNIQGSTSNSGGPTEPWLFYINVGVEFNNWPRPPHMSSCSYVHWHERIEFILPELLEPLEHGFELPAPPSTSMFSQPLAESIENASQQIASHIEDIQQYSMGERKGPAFSRYPEGFKPVIEEKQKSLILFHSPELGIGKALRALTDHSLSVKQQDDALLICRDQGPLLYVKYESGQTVREKAVRLSKTFRGKPYAVLLNSCDACFEISFDNFESALQEINTLIDVQLTLQDITQGLLYNTWNRGFSTSD